MARIPLRPVQIEAYGGLAVTPHHLSTQAALHILDEGGNAVDAAIAANAVQGVVAPETCGIGGDLFALVKVPGRSAPLTLNSSGRAGTGATSLAEELRASGIDEIPQDHPAAVTVPGCVDGWLALNERLGRLDLASILGPAVRLARRGFPAGRELASAFAARRDRFHDPLPDLYPGGDSPLEGTRITRGTLARTLERIGTEGRNGFYSGEVGEAIRAAVNGALTPDDMARPQAEWVDPLSIDLLGMTGWTVPPNSQGYLSLLALAVMEKLGVPEKDDPAGWHLAIEAYRLAASDRDELLADPQAMEVPASALLERGRIESLADRFDPDKAVELSASPSGLGGTAYLCVADGEDVGVSLIQSNFHGIGSDFPVPAGGFVLHDRGRGFDLRPGHPNELSAGRRPLHTLSPTLWTRDSELAALLGTRGGFMQPQLMIQMAVSAFAGDADPGPAQAIPRWMVPLPGRARGSQVEVEPGTPDAVVTNLQERGHAVHRHEVPQAGWGPVSLIRRQESGLLSGAPDPRVDTAAAGGR